jgi:heme/copper-type cytochrome/quinol oxidase subunit 2
VAFIVDILGNSIAPNYLNIMSYVWWIVSTIVIFLLTRLYYFKQKPKNPLKAGVTLGLLLVIITFLIEIPLIVYGFGMSWKIYLFWMTWIQYSRLYYPQ